MKPIRGTTERCFAHLGKAIAGPDYLEKRNVIAQFTGVDAQSVRRWLRSKRAPIGEALVRLQFYLEFLGYEVEELKELDSTVRDAARMYAFGISSLPAIARFIGYGGDESSWPSVVLTVFRGIRGVPPEKLEKFESFVREHQKELLERQKKTLRILSLPHGESTVAAPVLKEAAAHVPAFSNDADDHSVTIELFAKLVLALAPIAEFIASDSFTAQERDIVRELTGGNGISRLSNALTRLYGEAVRKALATQHKEGTST